MFQPRVLRLAVLVVLTNFAGAGSAFSAPESLLAASTPIPESRSTLASTPEKSGPQPGIAATLAFAPGIVLHGSGHFYAGRPLTGTLLLLAEAGAVYMAYRGITDITSVVDEIDLEDINYYGQSEQLSRGVGMAIGGLMLFLTSWLYDVTGSPLAVLEQGDVKKQKTADTGPVLIPKLSGCGVKVVIDRLF
jgi:TM2 domain-containing membrane protein YozV